MAKTRKKHERDQRGNPLDAVDIKGLIQEEIPGHGGLHAAYGEGWTNPERKRALSGLGPVKHIRREIVKGRMNTDAVIIRLRFRGMIFFVSNTGKIITAFTVQIAVIS
jgi:hypothetical protein